MKDLDGIEVGSRVIVYGGGSSAIDFVAYISRETKTQWIIEEKRQSGGVVVRRFSKSHGREVGGSSYYARHIRVGTPDEIARLQRNAERRHMAAILKGVNWMKVPSDVMRDILERLRA